MAGFLFDVAFLGRVFLFYDKLSLVFIDFGYSFCFFERLPGIGIVRRGCISQTGLCGAGNGYGRPNRDGGCGSHGHPSRSGTNRQPNAATNRNTGISRIAVGGAI